MIFFSREKEEGRERMNRGMCGWVDDVWSGWSTGLMTGSMNCFR